MSPKSGDCQSCLLEPCSFLSPEMYWSDEHKAFRNNATIDHVGEAKI